MTIQRGFVLPKPVDQHLVRRAKRDFDGNLSGVIRHLLERDMKRSPVRK